MTWKRCPRCGHKHCGKVPVCTTCIEGLEAAKGPRKLAAIKKTKRAIFAIDIADALAEDRIHRGMIEYVPTHEA